MARALAGPQLDSDAFRHGIENLTHSDEVKTEAGHLACLSLKISGADGSPVRAVAIEGLPVLQAAHIKPLAKSGPHRVDHGLLLRSDLHTLLDRGYVRATPEHRIEVSRRIGAEFENGRDDCVFMVKP